MGVMLASNWPDGSKEQVRGKSLLIDSDPLTGNAEGDEGEKKDENLFCAERLSGETPANIFGDTTV